MGRLHYRNNKCVWSKAPRWPNPPEFSKEGLLSDISPLSSKLLPSRLFWGRVEEGEKESESPLYSLTQVLCPSFLQSKVHLRAWRKWRRRKKAQVTMFAFVSFPVMGKMFLASNIFTSFMSLPSVYDALHACHISSFRIGGEGEEVKLIAHIRNGPVKVLMHE